MLKLLNVFDIWRIYTNNTMWKLNMRLSIDTYTHRPESGKIQLCEHFCWEFAWQKVHRQILWSILQSICLCQMKMMQIQRTRKFWWKRARKVIQHPRYISIGWARVCVCVVAQARYLMKWNYLFMHHYIFSHTVHWIQLNVNLYLFSVLPFL